MPEIVAVCPLCGGEDFDTLLTARDRSFSLPGEFPVRKCQACGLYATSPRPTRQEISQYYRDSYEPHTGQDWSPKTPAAQKKFRWRILLTKEFWIPDLPAGSEVLEIGCGTGSFLGTLKGLGWKLHGVELFPKPAQLARERHGVEIHQGEAESVSLPSEKFDAIFAWMVIEHLFEPVAAVRKLAKSLKPGGYFVISVPNAGSWELKIFKEDWFALEIPRHLYHYTPKTIQGLFEAAGLRLEKVLYPLDLRNLSRSLRYKYPKLAGTRFYGLVDRVLGHKLTMLTLGWLISIFRQSGRMVVVGRKEAVDR